MRLNPDKLEMVCDKIRGYAIHNADKWVCVNFKGSWVMSKNGFYVQTSTTNWPVSNEILLSRSEELEQLVTNIVNFCDGSAMIGIRKGEESVRLCITHWFETEFEARTIAEARMQNKIYDCIKKEMI